MRRIAFFGGSFDPPHIGHLAIAKAAADRFALDEVLFAPVARQPLKEDVPAAAFLHRYAMTALATEADPRFTASLLDAPPEDSSVRKETSELRDDSRNYSVDTLTRLRDSLGAEAELSMLLGADSWLQIGRWRDPARLLSLCDWIVAARPGFSLSNAERALPPGVEVEPIAGRITRSDSDQDPDLGPKADPGPKTDAVQPCLLLRHSNGGSTRVFLLEDVWMDISATALRAALQAGGSGGKQLPASVREYIRKTGLYSREAGSGRCDRF